MIEVSAHRRKYKFNVIDYLWYMGKDSWRVPLRRWPSPFGALANCLIIIPLIFCGFYFGAIYPQYSKYIFISFVIGAFATSLSCDFLLKKYRFTEEREPQIPRKETLQHKDVILVSVYNYGHVVYYLRDSIPILLEKL